MLYIDDIRLKPKTTTRILITYWSEGLGQGQIVSVSATVCSRIRKIEGLQSWRVQIDGRDTPSTIREIRSDGAIELVLEL